IGLIFGSQFALEVFKQVAQRIGLYDRPREALGTVLNFFLSLAELPWLGNTLLFFGGLAAGLLLSWLLRRLDGSRADERKALGTEMVKLGNLLRGYSGKLRKLYMHEVRPKIVSCFTTAKKVGILVPDDRIFSVNPAHAMDLIADYLMDVGTMLQGRHFSEAKQHAKSRKVLFDKLILGESRLHPSQQAKLVDGHE